jgi:glycosyltransferase involved in cell wall biosynthesis
MKTHKIVLVINCSNFFVSHFLPLANELKSHGHDVYIISGNRNQEDFLKKQGFKFHCNSMSRKGINFFQEASSIVKLYKYIKNIQPDIIHSFTIKPVLYSGLLHRCFFKYDSIYIASITGLGFTFLGTGFLGILKRKIVTGLYRNCFHPKSSKVIFENKTDLNFFIHKKITKKNNTYLVNGAGIDTERFKPKLVNNSAVTVSVVSRMLKDKGIREVILAGKALKKLDKNIIIQLIGNCDKNNPSTLTSEELNDAQSAGYITWLGHRTDIDIIYQNSDIALLASYREGLPKSLLEAASSGLPIITTDTPGCRDVIENDKSGILVPLKNHQAITDAIIKLAEDVLLRDEMGKEGRKIAIEKYDVNIVLSTFLSIYEV